MKCELILCFLFIFLCSCLVPFLFSFLAPFLLVQLERNALMNSISGSLKRAEQTLRLVHSKVSVLHGTQQHNNQCVSTTYTRARTHTHARNNATHILAVVSTERTKQILEFY